MLKRIFWLVAIIVIAWTFWRWLRQHDHAINVASEPMPVLPPANRVPHRADQAPARSQQVADQGPVVSTQPVVPEPAAAPQQQLEEVPPATDKAQIEGAVLGYCVRCKTKRPISDAREEKTESGRRAARGTCPVCNTNMFTFLPDN